MTGLPPAFAGTGYRSSSGKLPLEEDSHLGAASVVASFTCESLGPDRLLEVTLDEVESRMSQLKALASSCQSHALKKLVAG